MRLYLAGIETYYKGKYALNIPKNTLILTSFYYCNDDYIRFLISKVGRENILMDSGAYTFRTHGLKGTNIEEYTKKYIDFINKHDIKYFFEMDIDTNLEEYEKVKLLRHKIETETGKKCIPVFHHTRGVNEWYNLCDNYDYIAVGGIAGKTNKQYMSNLKKLIKYAKNKNTKVHGLGYTSKDAQDIGFYSVDSTSWQSGKYGQIFYNSLNLKYPKSCNKPDKHRIKQDKIKELMQHNFNVWYNYQQNLLKGDKI